MYDSKKERGFQWCQHCGGDKVWHGKEWTLLDGLTFCSAYCRQNFEAFMFRMAQRKRMVK